LEKTAEIKKELVENLIRSRRRALIGRGREKREKRSRRRALIGPRREKE
jgi:hypothetical protein